jgi:hypothetical protein
MNASFMAQDRYKIDISSTVKEALAHCGLCTRDLWTLLWCQVLWIYSTSTSVSGEVCAERTCQWYSPPSRSPYSQY